MKVAGIDYSVSCPCICVFDTDDIFSFDKCQFYFITGKVGLEPISGNLNIKFLPRKNYKDRPDVAWYNVLSHWAIDVLDENDVERVFLEDYAFSRSSRSTTILAENGGILKCQLLRNCIRYDTVASTAWKKHCLDKGNANKEFVLDSMGETGVGLLKEFNLKNAGQAPVQDIVDSYYICKFGIDTLL